MITIGQNVLKAIAFSRHQKRTASIMPPEQVAVTFLQCKQTINCRSDLPAHVPVIQGCCKDDYITFLHSGINLRHIIFLDAGTLTAAVPTKTALATVDVHFIKKELSHGISSTLRTFCKLLNQCGSVPVSAGASV